MSTYGHCCRGQLHLNANDYLLWAWRTSTIHIQMRRLAGQNVKCHCGDLHRSCRSGGVRGSRVSTIVLWHKREVVQKTEFCVREGHSCQIRENPSLFSICPSGSVARRAGVPAHSRNVIRRYVKCVGGKKDALDAGFAAVRVHESAGRAVLGK